MAKANPYPARNQCCFIAGEGPWISKPIDWCRRPRVAGSPYCEAHHRLCYHVLPKKRDGKPIIFARIAPL